MHPANADSVGVPETTFGLFDLIFVEPLVIEISRASGGRKLTQPIMMLDTVRPMPHMDSRLCVPV
jgi:hypothetical protein